MTMIDTESMERLQQMLQARHDLVNRYSSSGSAKLPGNIEDDIMSRRLGEGGQGEVSTISRGPKARSPREAAMVSNVALNTLANQFTGRIQQGMLGGLVTGSMPGLMDVLNPAAITAGFASALPGAMTKATLGIVDPLSKFTQSAASLLGSVALGPIAGIGAGLVGLVGGDALADAFGIREDEAYRDLLEDKFGYFSGRQAYSLGTPGFQSSMLDQAYGRSDRGPSMGFGNYSGSIDSYQDAVDYASAPVDSFDVDFGYLSDPELDYTYDPITAPPTPKRHKAATSTTAGARDSTTFGEDIGQTFGGDMDPHGDRMGGLEPSFGGGGRGRGGGGGGGNK